jgi:surfeit locus 1 family protein
MTAERRGLPLGLTAATLIALAILVGLGTWQVQRLAWKRDLLARIAAVQVAPARPIGPVLHALPTGSEADFIRVRVTCPGLASAPFLELYAIRDGQVGSRLISACALSGGRYRTVLVDRGFVGDTISARPPVDPDRTDAVDVVGVLRRPEPAGRFSPRNTPRRWYTRDVAGMAAALRAPDPAPVFILAETSSNPAWRALVPSPVPKDIPNNHLGYAITWYGLAAALLGVYAAVLWKRRKA